MVEYRQNNHSVWDVKYHMIWVTKYRYKVLRGEIAVRTRDLLRQICQGREVTIVQGSVSPDHVHKLVSVPPQLAPAKLVQYLKGRSSHMLQAEFPPVEEAVLGPTSVGARVFLRERGRAGRGADSAIHRKPEVGRPWGELQDHSAKRALSRLSAGRFQAASAANRRLSVATQTHRLLGGGRLAVLIDCF
jgi:putative transposase